MIDPARLAPDAGNPAVANVMRDEVVFCLPSTPLDAVAKLMADNDISEVAVLIDRRPVGYVASRDIIERFVEGGVDLTGSDLVRQSFVTTVAGDVLRTPPLLVDERTPFDDVVGMMRRHSRTTALVMHEDDVAVGMITVREVAATLGRRQSSTLSERGDG